MGRPDSRKSQPDKRKAATLYPGSKATAPRVVLDTNIIIGAIFEADEWARNILRAQRDGFIISISSDKMVGEVVGIFLKIAEKEKIPVGELIRPLSWLAKLLLRSEPCNPDVDVDICEDEDDNKFIACALAGNARYIITADPHLTSIASITIREKYGTDIYIMSPYQFFHDVLKTRSAVSRKKSF